jgi:hypothetical protein
MFNFHSEFLNGKLNSDEEVYEESDGKKYVCILFKSLYELKQAGNKVTTSSLLALLPTLDLNIVKLTQLYK